MAEKIEKIKKGEKRIFFSKELPQLCGHSVEVAFVADEEIGVLFLTGRIRGIVYSCFDHELLTEKQYKKIIQQLKNRG